MKVSSVDKTIRDILQANYFKIPRFQRPYSWTNENIEDFWNDVVVENTGDYFIGSMVVFKIKDSLMGLVDGQQRMTTITMMLSSIRDAFKKIGEASLANGTHNLIERTDLDNMKQFVLQTETSYPYFHEKIQKFGAPDFEMSLQDEEKKLEKSHTYIIAKIEDEMASIDLSTTISPKIKQESKKNKLKEIRKKVLDLKLIYVDLDNEDDAYLIFETLNTRGKNLRVSDLVKNLITKLYKNKNKGVDIAKDQWSKCVETIETSSSDLKLDTFLLHFWLSRYGYTSLPKLFKHIKKHVTKNNVKGFLTEINTNAKLYREIRDISYRKWTNQEEDLRKSIKAIIDFKVTQPIPMLLSAFREYSKKDITLKQLKDIVKSIEYFHFIFTAVTSQRSSGGISTMYCSHAKKLSEALSKDTKQATVKELKVKFKNKIPSREEFIASFKEIEYSTDNTKHKPIVQYILRKLYEYDNKSSTTGTPIDFNQMTIEHITPDSTSNSWKGMIGNLIYVSNELNNKLGTKSFKRKKEILETSDLKLDYVLSKSNKWTKSEVIERTENIAGKCYENIFRI